MTMPVHQNRTRLVFSPAAIDSLRASGLRQRNPERLRWTDEHLVSRYGGGVLLRVKFGDILDGAQFRALCDALGVAIETDNFEQVVRALGVPADEPGIKAWPPGPPFTAGRCRRACDAGE
jgi:hypothetical protein